MMSRAEVTELVVTRKLEKKLSWTAIADAVGQSKLTASSVSNRHRPPAPMIPTIIHLPYHTTIAKEEQHGKPKIHTKSKQGGSPYGASA